MAIREHPLGELDGRPVSRFTLESTGLRCEILSYGATLAALSAPDRDGRFADIVLGFGDLAGYVGGRGYLGAVIGRCANRIAGGRFALNGVAYQLATNEGSHHLHGGPAGFDKAVWQARPRTTPTGAAVELAHTSPHGDQGYPGNLSATATYTLEPDGIRIDYTATCDRDTILNLTNHSYWNLAGHAAGSILGHQVMLDADRFAAVGPGQIPTSELRAVAGTPLDFRRPAAIGTRIDDDDDQLRIGGGYDHSFAITGADGSLRRAARVTEPTTGRVLEVLTTEPAIQLYSGNYLDGMAGKAGAIYHRRTGFCLETQHHPDSPNHPGFPTTRLPAGAHYRSTTVYRLATEPPAR